MTMHQLSLLCLATTMVMLQSASAQLPLRIDVTWFENHDEWRQRSDAVSESSNGHDDAAKASEDEEETDKHTQQACNSFVKIYKQLKH